MRLVDKSTSLSIQTQAHTQTLNSTKTFPKTFLYANVFAISAAILIGAVIISTVGLASPEVLHNAAHDIRHGLAFPCH